MKKKYILINESGDDPLYYPFILLPYKLERGNACFGFQSVVSGGYKHTDEEECLSKYLRRGNIYNTNDLGQQNPRNIYKCMTIYLSDVNLLISEDIHTQFLGYNLLLKKYEKRIEKEFNCKIPWEKIGTKK